MSSKGGKGAAAKAKKPGKAGAEDKREDVLQAVVLAESFQTRFRPFSLDKPRCLLKIANTPLIEYTLAFLAMNGVQEVFIYAGPHQEQVEAYIRRSRWDPNSRACPFSSVDFIPVSKASSIGDFLRDLDNRSLIEGDFVLVHGDLISNIPLDGILAAHRARKEANRDSMMTIVLREGGEHEHQTKVKGISPVFAIDPRQKRCLHYEEIHPLQQEHYVDLDPDVLKDPELEIRADLIDAEIDICTPDVLALWSESFDYELPRANFLHGTLKDFELNGKMIHTEVISDGYCARASNLQMLEAIGRDVTKGWAVPFAPDSNMLKGQTYQLWEGGVFKEDGVTINIASKVADSVIGKHTEIGPASTVRSSVIGRECNIGKGVRITDSILGDNVTVEDGAIIEHAVLADLITVGKESEVGEGCLLGSGVIIGEKITLASASVISTIDSNFGSVKTDTTLVGAGGKGAAYEGADTKDLESDDPARLQQSLVYSLDGLDIDASSVSTFEDDEFLDDEDHPSMTTGSRSRLGSFASDDSSIRDHRSFLNEAAHSLVEVLSGKRGDLAGEKMEFTSLRLASNASDAAVRRAIATAFVRRSVELLNLETGAMDPAKAAKTVLTERKGAKEFIMELAMDDGSVAEQVEFALAMQQACAAQRTLDVTRAGNLLAALFQNMYNLEIMEEEGILGWWADSRSSRTKQTGAGADELEAKDSERESRMVEIRDKCKTLVDWLEEAEEESESDDDD